MLVHEAALIDTASAALLATLILSTLQPKLFFLLFNKPDLTYFNFITLVKLLNIVCMTRCFTVSESLLCAT